MHSNAEAATIYWPVHVRDFDRMLDSVIHHADERWRVNPTDRTFIDVGSGKGRAALVASDRGFASVIGVDFAESYVDLAGANARKFRNGELCSPVSFIHADATEWDMPTKPLLVYFFHPFDERVMVPFVARLMASLQASPRPCTIIYLNPVHEDVLLSTGQFERQYVHGRYADNRYSLLRYRHPSVHPT
jgi:SAM-dependent methyltransferase